jgi:hypothetical protein
MNLSGKIKFLKKRLYSFVYVRSRIPKILDRWRARGRKNAVFIWIPKNAGTSLHETMDCPKILESAEVPWRFCGSGLVTFGHMDYHALLAKGWVSEEFDRTAFKFAFLRNPYSRAVSLYFYLKSKRFPGDWSFGDFCRMLERDGVDPIGITNSKGLVQCNPQIRWLENLRMDFLGRSETVDQDFALIQEQLGLPRVDVPKLNKSTKSDYRELYDEKSRKLVLEFYREDFDRLGYSEDLSRTGLDSIIKVPQLDFGCAESQ